MMKFRTIEEVEKFLEEKVALLNRMIRQHPKSPAFISWFNMKEFIESELLGHTVDYEM